MIALDRYLGDGVFAPSGPEAAGTVKTLNSLFCSSFPINQADTAAGVPGILYGRYQGDTYAGGNPWVLLTAALGQLLYNAAQEIVVSSSSPSSAAAAALTAEARSLWADVLGWPEAAELSAPALAEALSGAADGVLTRLSKHVASAGYHLNEQLDKSSGAPMAAADLTWSYATVLKAMYYRAQYYTAASKAE
jgi:glucoamylase